MLALILAGCLGPTREQMVCADNVDGYLYVRAYEELVVGPEPDTRCASTALYTGGYAGYDRVPERPSLTLQGYRARDSEPYTLAGLLDGFPEVGLGSTFTRAVFEFGTRHGGVFPLPEGERPEGYQVPVQPADALISSVVTPLGVEVIGRSAGLVAEVPDASGGVELVVRCSDCDVVVPYAPTTLEFQLERATVHLCFDESATVLGSLTDTVVQVQPLGEQVRKAIDVAGSVEIGGPSGDLAALLIDTNPLVSEGGGLCRTVEDPWTR